MQLSTAYLQLTLLCSTLNCFYSYLPLLYHQFQLGIEITPREVNIRDPRITVQAILRSWLPVSGTICINFYNATID